VTKESPITRGPDNSEKQLEKLILRRDSLKELIDDLTCIKHADTLSDTVKNGVLIDKYFGYDVLGELEEELLLCQEEIKLFTQIQKAKLLPLVCRLHNILEAIHKQE
jgi:hypothetical protein